MQLLIQEVHVKLICDGKIVGRGGATYHYVPNPYSNGINWAVSNVTTTAYIKDDINLSTHVEYHNQAPLSLMNTKDSKQAEKLFEQTLKQVFGPNSQCLIEIEMEVFEIEKQNPPKAVRIYKNHIQSVQTVKISEDKFNYDEKVIDYNSSFNDIIRDFLT